MTFIVSISAVFCESTVAGLKFYREPGWENTADVVAFFLRMWNVQNVKSAYKGIFNFIIFKQFTLVYYSFSNILS